MNSPDFLKTADEIGRDLVRDAFWDGDACTWLGWNMEPNNGQFVNAYRAFGFGTYGGTSGVALFLAYLERQTGSKIYRKTLNGALNQITRTLPGPAYANAWGYFGGVLGASHFLIKIGELIQHEGLVQRGLGSMEALVEAPFSDQAIDVISGSAGAVPALLDIGQFYHRDQLVEQAEKHGDHLLQLAVKGPHGWHWDTMGIPEQPALTGHSHGTAGIGLALLELHATTGQPRYLEGAEGAFTYERALYSQAHGNWPDLRTISQDPQSQEATYNMAWCHGAPGIALSRLRALALRPEDDQIRREVDIALHTTAQSLQSQMHQPQLNYSLCHGLAGNADALIEAALQFNRPELHQIAVQVGLAGQSRFGGCNNPWPCGVPGAGQTPGLLIGTAGIGYFYLRLDNSLQVPTQLVQAPRQAISQIRPS